MTKGEARDIYLRYIGEATVNGKMRDDPDLADMFELMLYPALVQVGSAFPPTETAEVCGLWQAPDNLIEIKHAYDKNGEPVSFRRRGERGFYFRRLCNVEYTRTCAVPDASQGDAAELDVDKRAAHLIPLQIAIHAAVALPEYAYKVPYLSASYQAFSAVLGSRDAASYRRVFAV